MMETLPLFAPKGQLKLAGGAANGTTPFAAPPEHYSLISPSKIKSAMDGGFDLAEDCVGRTPAWAPCQRRQIIVRKTQPLDKEGPS